MTLWVNLRLSEKIQMARKLLFVGTILLCVTAEASPLAAQENPVTAFFSLCSKRARQIIGGSKPAEIPAAAAENKPFDPFMTAIVELPPLKRELGQARQLETLVERDLPAVIEDFTRRFKQSPDATRNLAFHYIDNQLRVNPELRKSFQDATMAQKPAVDQKVLSPKDFEREVQQMGDGPLVEFTSVRGNVRRGIFYGMHDSGYLIYEEGSSQRYSLYEGDQLGSAKILSRGDGDTKVTGDFFLKEVLPDLSARALVEFSSGQGSELGYVSAEGNELSIERLSQRGSKQIIPAPDLPKIKLRPIGRFDYFKTRGR